VLELKTKLSPAELGGKPAENTEICLQAAQYLGFFASRSDCATTCACHPDVNAMLVAPASNFVPDSPFWQIASVAAASTPLVYVVAATLLLPLLHATTQRFKSRG
ncbi:MAG: hypothetical protein OXQ92_12925, partial [Boseongicola sp.]|nr:hypothetical protein [Boseongicola sp.]